MAYVFTIVRFDASSNKIFHIYESTIKIQLIIVYNVELKMFFTDNKDFYWKKNVLYDTERNNVFLSTVSILGRCVTYTGYELL